VSEAPRLNRQALTGAVEAARDFADSSWIDSGPLATYSLGGVGHPLFLVHGAGLCGLSLIGLGRQLTSSFEVFALDLPGHGRSPALDPDGAPRLDWLRFIDPIRKTVEVIAGGSPAFVFGHSLGGTLAAMIQAIGEISWAGLAAFEPIGASESGDSASAHDPTTEYLAESTSRRRSHFTDWEEAIDYLSGRPIYRGWGLESLAGFLATGLREAATGGIDLACSAQFEAAIYRGRLSAPAAWPDGPPDRPTLLIRGQEDGRPIMRASPTQTQMALPFADHFAPQSRPDQLARVVKSAFIR
jgi:pimeloyl-ACP methyl ester carboxylesterase